MQLTWKFNQLFIQNHTYKNIDDLLQALYLSKKTKYILYTNHCISLNKHVVTTNTSIDKNDLITINPLEEADDGLIPCFETIDVLYEDDLFLIINKPSGILVHSDGNDEITLYNLVKGYYLVNGIYTPVRAIHRLDKETSGVILFCKIVLLQPLLDAMIKEKKIKRKYYALCEGIIKKDVQINKKIARDRHNAKRMRISNTGKDAITDVHVLGYSKDFSFVECSLHQGRTHQIRVHMESIQHPLLHDTLYGNNDSRINRCALHSHEVEFIHPLTKKIINVQAKLNKDMLKLAQIVKIK